MAQIVDDYASARLPEAQLEMLHFAAKLTRSPQDMRRADVDALRSVGFTDRDVLAIVEVAAYYAYANRIADGLGIELEAATLAPTV